MFKLSFCPVWLGAVALFAAISAAGLAADLYTKYAVFQALGMPGTYKSNAQPELQSVYWIMPNIFGFQTSLNAGALFGIGQGQTAFLAVLSVIFLTGILVYLLRWAWKSPFLSAVLGMITAGICGNLYDRLGWHGLVYPEFYPSGAPCPSAGEPIYAVRDWVLCMLGNYPWPNFNIADALLVCSVAVLLINEFLEAGKKSKLGV